MALANRKRDLKTAKAFLAAKLTSRELARPTTSWLFLVGHRNRR